MTERVKKNEQFKIKVSFLNSSMYGSNVMHGMLRFKVTVKKCILPLN